MVRPERIELPTSWFVAISMGIVRAWVWLYLYVKYENGGIIPTQILT
jgi:hypothetical protein